MLVETEELFELIGGDDTENLTHVETVYLGNWRWGSIFQLVVKDKEGKLWGIDFREGTGDEYYNSLQTHLEHELVPMDSRPVTKTEYFYVS